MKNLFTIIALILLFSSSSYSQWIPIDSIRVQDADGVPLLLNQTVTTRGVVTTTREFGPLLVYFQTGTAGMVGYDTSFANNVKRGDSVEVTGVVTQFSGLTELNPVTAITVLDTGISVTPIPVTTTEVKDNGEALEGMLLKISNVTAIHDFNGADVTTWNVSGSGFNFRLLANGDSCDIRIYATTNIANQPVMAFPFDVVAECSQFKFSAPFIGGYQLLPRSLSDFSIATGVNTVSNDIPDSYKLDQNYPNPFNPGTNISYRLAKGGDVALKVYDMLGNEVVTLVNEKQSAGSYEVRFDAGKLSSGIYFYKLQTGNFFDAKKMILIK